MDLSDIIKPTEMGREEEYERELLKINDEEIQRSDYIVLREIIESAGLTINDCITGEEYKRTKHYLIKGIGYKTENTRVTELYIRQTELKEIPETIGELSKLKYIDLSENKIIRLPENIGKLKKLKRLYLSENKITKLPESIGKLSKLEFLYLNFNQLTKLPDSIGELSKLKELHLSGNKLTTLPESIGKLSKLETLMLSNNKLTRLPETIAELSRLILNLNANPLLKIPEKIKKSIKIYQNKPNFWK